MWYAPASSKRITLILDLAGLLCPVFLREQATSQVLQPVHFSMSTWMYFSVAYPSSGPSLPCPSRASATPFIPRASRVLLLGIPVLTSQRRRA